MLRNLNKLIELGHKPGLEFGVVVHIGLYVGPCEVLKVGLVYLPVDLPAFLAGFSLGGEVASIGLERVTAGRLQLTVCFFKLRLHLCRLDLHQRDAVQH